MMATELKFNVSALDEWLAKNGRGSKERLCATMGASGSFIDKLRRTERLPTGTKLFALADALGIPVEKLVVRTSKKRST